MIVYVIRLNTIICYSYYVRKNIVRVTILTYFLMILFIKLIIDNKVSIHKNKIF